MMVGRVPKNDVFVPICSIFLRDKEEVRGKGGEKGNGKELKEIRE